MTPRGTKKKRVNDELASISGDKCDPKLRNQIMASGVGEVLEPVPCTFVNHVPIIDRSNSTSKSNLDLRKNLSFLQGSQDDASYQSAAPVTQRFQGCAV